MRVGLILILTLCFLALPAAAQTETYTWSPYEFTLTLPNGWTAVPDADRLLLGTPADVDKIAVGELPEGATVAVQIIEPLHNAENTLMYYVPNFRQVEPVTTAQYLYVDLPVFAGRQIRLAYIAPNYLLTASAPVAAWGEFVPVLDALAASIEAGPVEQTPAESLTQAFRWGGLSFSVPDNYLWNSIPNNQIYIVTTEFNRLSTMTRFQVDTLWLDVVRLSHLRSTLSPDSLNVVRGFWYDPERVTLGDISVSEINGIPAAMVDFADETQTGRAVLMMSQNDAYLISGMAGKEQWVASEAALFDAILATAHLE